MCGIEAQLVDWFLFDGIVNGSQTEKAHGVAFDFGILVLVDQSGACPVVGVQYRTHHVSKIVDLRAL